MLPAVSRTNFDLLEIIAIEKSQAFDLPDSFFLFARAKECQVLTRRVRVC